MLTPFRGRQWFCDASSKLYWLRHYLHPGVHLKRSIPVRKRIEPESTLKDTSGSSVQASEFSSKSQIPDHQARHRRVEYDGATPMTEHEALSTHPPSQRHHVRSL